jgi:ribosomal protein S27E
MPEAAAKEQFACPGCGAGMQFSPETGQLKCPHCGNTQALIAGSTVKAHEFTGAIAEHLLQPITANALQVTCSGCGSVVAFEPPEVAGVCSFCGTAIVAQPKAADPLIAPDGVLPVKLPKQDALSRLQRWLSSRWFAPSALKRLARPEGLNGVYLPFWTYYFDTLSSYVGERGEHYYVTETYEERDSDGHMVTRTREVQHTRWYPASGSVSDDFNNILVPATKAVPEKRLNKLQPWDLNALCGYEPAYLAGFRAQRYQVELAQGFEDAKAMVAPAIQRHVERDIGGDEQRVISINTTYNNIYFLHLLLPVWIGAYQFQKKVYHVVVNARTGDVEGERPYSPWKITLFVLAIIAIILGIVFWVNYDNGRNSGASRQSGHPVGAVEPAVNLCEFQLQHKQSGDRRDRVIARDRKTCRANCNGLDLAIDSKDFRNQSRVGSAESPITAAVASACLRLA